MDKKQSINESMQIYSIAINMYPMILFIHLFIFFWFCLLFLTLNSF